MNDRRNDLGRNDLGKNKGPALSRRDLVNSLLVAPLSLPALSKRTQQLQTAAQPASACCTGTFHPDDLFATSSVAGDLERARKGDLASTMRLGFAYYTGLGGVVDIPRARSYFLVASHASPAGAAWLGYVDATIHNQGGASVRKRASFKGLMSAVQAGDPVAQTLLGRIYERGLAGYKARPDKAKPLYVSASSQFALAKTYWGRLLVKSGQCTQALGLFQQAAQAGETTAMIAIADLFSRLKHPAKMSAAMNRWLRKA